VFPGTHSGKKFANLFYETLRKYDIVDKIHTLTADNALVNAKMACKLDQQIPQFNSLQHILGCVAHVINLAAKVGISALGSTEDHGDGEEVSMAKIDTNSESQPNPMNISLLVSPPDSTKINSNTIIKRVHGLCTWVRFLPQRRERFAIAVHSCQPELQERKVKGLEIDFPTRWNLTYSMFQRALLLQKSCDHFCKQNSEAGRFSLSPAE